MEAREFLQFVNEAGYSFDAILFDPPYSPRQISEVYKQVGREIGSAGTQNSRLYKGCRDLFRPLVQPGGVVLSFGWNTSTMGKGFELREILLVAHGGAHNDTLCRAEVRLEGL